MRLELTSHQNKFANRILALVVACALFPSVCLAVLSLSFLTEQVDRKAMSRLREESGMIARLVEVKLERLERQMGLLADSLDSLDTVALDPAAGRGPSECDVPPEFDGLSVFFEDGDRRDLLGPVTAVRELSAAVFEQARDGRIIVWSLPSTDTRSTVMLARAVDPSRLELGCIVAQLDAAFLWTVDESSLLPAGVGFVLVDLEGRVLISSSHLRGEPKRRFFEHIAAEPLGMFAWNEDEPQLAGAASMRMMPAFSPPGWKVVLSNPRRLARSTLASLKRMLAGVGLVSLLASVLLGMTIIRRRVAPLRELQDGNERLAAWDFDARVELKTGDEFEDLAESFNAMAERLSKQFHTLTTMAEIQSSILGSLTNEVVVDSVLTRMRDIVPYDLISVTILGGGSGSETFLGVFDPEFRKIDATVNVAESDIALFSAHTEHLVLDSNTSLPTCLDPLVERGARHFVVLPVFLKGALTGFITLGNREQRAYSDEDLAHIRQLADQVTLALSTARLIDELDQINIGTLVAFARAIDAKSPWTAGHSERVTRMAVRIGRALGLSAKELDIIHRGGLVHDIGKIGIPPEILDKPGKLTDEEFDMMRQHTVLGARILEPISAYAEIIPIVLSHHERYDGKGYPQGLAGEEIDPNARILGVADCFDAMISDRPYRPGLDLAVVLETIERGAGSQFDPVVVDAFLRLMENDRDAYEAFRDPDAAELSVVSS